MTWIGGAREATAAQRWNALDVVSTVRHAMRDCENGEIRDLLPEYLHDALEPVARARVEAHLASCDACAAELSLLRGIRGALSRAPAVDVSRIAESVRRATSASSRRGVHAETDGGGAARRAPGSRRRLEAWQWSVAAAVLVAVGTFAYAASHGSRPPLVAPVAVRPERTMPGSASRPARDTSRALATPATPSTTLAQRDERSHAGSRAPSAATVIAPSTAPDADALLGGLGELSDEDARAMLERLDQVQALPDAEPAPVLDVGDADLAGAGIS